MVIKGPGFSRYGYVTMSNNKIAQTPMVHPKSSCLNLPEMGGKNPPLEKKSHHLVGPEEPARVS
jgi:hypothetical protein